MYHKLHAWYTWHTQTYDLMKIRHNQTLKVKLHNQTLKIEAYYFMGNITQL